MAAMARALVNAATIGLLLCSKTAIDRQVAANQGNVEGIIRRAVPPLPRRLTTSSLWSGGPLLGSRLQAEELQAATGLWYHRIWLFFFHFQNIQISAQTVCQPAPVFPARPLFSKADYFLTFCF